MDDVINIAAIVVIFAVCLCVCFCVGMTLVLIGGHCARAVNRVANKLYDRRW